MVVVVVMVVVVTVGCSRSGSTDWTTAREGAMVTGYAIMTPGIEALEFRPAPSFSYFQSLHVLVPMDLRAGLPYGLVPQQLLSEGKLLPSTGSCLGILLVDLNPRPPCLANKTRHSTLLSTPYPSTPSRLSSSL